MAGQPTDYGREVRDTIVKSSLTGVAATVLAVTVFSPAGFGGLIGTSLASGFGLDGASANAADDPYAVLPAYPAPLSQDELSEIRGQLARTTASLEITRAATEAKIEYIRSIALTDREVTFTAAIPQTQQVEALRLTMSEPAEAAAPVQAAAAPVSYSMGNAAGGESYRDPNMELAELLLAHETF